jgi:hypothetical protein
MRYYPKKNQRVPEFKTHKERRLQILEVADRVYGCLCNAEWCQALTNEPDMKWLVRRGMVELKRERYYGWGSKPYTRFTKAYITDRGREYLLVGR